MCASVSTSCSPERRCARPALAATHGSSESTEARWRFVLSSHGGRGVCDGTSCLLLSPALSHTQYTGRAQSAEACARNAQQPLLVAFFFSEVSALPPLLTRIAVASLRVQCDGNARWEYDLQPLLTLLSQSRTHHLRGEWAAYALEVLLPDSWTPITSPFEPLPSSSLPGSWHPPGSARAARRLIATDGEGGRRTSKGGVTALMRAMRLTPRE
jgi:hypothetical protein